MAEILVELEDVWKIYRMGEVEVPALRGLNLKIERGEFLVIMGPSVSSKTTAMNMIGCLDLPTKGRVLLEGRDISKLKEKELARIRGRKIGFVFQTFNLHPTLTAIENVQLPMRIHEFPEDEIEKRSLELLRLVGLEDRVHHLPSQLSGGESQRVAIARALSTNPPMLLADEPTGNIDTKAGSEILDIFESLNLKGITVVVITHDPLVGSRAKRLIKMRDGIIVDGEK
ncbi:MAG: ABC transporter ATP-binding protein [Halobacteria archaeon]